MATSAAGELVCDEFAILENNLFEEDTDFNLQLEHFSKDIIESEENTVFQCNLCAKVCKSQRGLSRHITSKHKKNNEIPGHSKTPVLQLLDLQKFILESVTKLAGDECYPEILRNELNAYAVGSLDHVVTHVYKIILNVVTEFDGNAEKFYPRFYKCISGENIFLNLSKPCSTLLGFELANHVLAHISGTRFKDDIFDCNPEPKEFTPKEEDIIVYLGGYVFGTLYRRMRFSKMNKSMYHQQCLSILLAGKLTSSASDTNTENKQQKLVDIKNRGGLWKINDSAIQIFKIVELKFRCITKTSHNKIDSHALVKDLITNCGILSNFGKLKNDSDEEVSEEISLNLLEHIMMLYIRARTFSFVQNKQQLHKIESKQKKIKSLRTELKKKTKSLDQGH